MSCLGVVGEGAQSRPVFLLFNPSSALALIQAFKLKTHRIRNFCQEIISNHGSRRCSGR